MFTGIIEGLGTITGTGASQKGRRVIIDADFSLAQAIVGDSIAVSGACLTAVEISDRRFKVDVSPETLKTTTLGLARVGDRVNLERALRFSDRLDGHLVSGHIDGTAKIKKIQNTGNAIIISFEVPKNLARYMIQKGSVAVDGISLTINRCDSASFEISVIPHTAQITTIGFKRINELVNIETDIIGKYVERFITSPGGEPNNNGPKKNEGAGIDIQFLGKAGFLTNKF